ncbi:MAG: type II secretion system F family protein [Candidatus Pacebacteria bacterium]|nr:type II secretion system F family protein [Candidatus Paceibacterota bacterium]
MAKFVYEGEASDGSKVRETVTADDRYAVYDVARNNGHTVSSVTEAKGFSLGVGGFDMEKINAWLGKVKQDELVMMTRNLGSMLDAGLTVTRALSVIERQSKNAKLKATVKDIIERINKGGQFFESLSAHPKVLLKKKIKGAMMYPSIVIIVMVIIGILMMIFVLPSITGIFKQMGTELPATTQILIATSDFLVANTVLALGAIIGFVTALLYALRSRPGKVVTSWLVTRIPVIGTMAKETNAARTARTLSSLLNSGVDVIQALEITEEVVQNVFYRRIIRAARDKVEKGTALSEIFIERSDLYPILVGEMILVGEETGSIAKMLGELAIFYETEVERKTKDLSTIIEPLLMVVIGTGVGFFALALIAPIYSIGDSIK